MFQTSVTLFAETVSASSDGSDAAGIAIVILIFLMMALVVAAAIGIFVTWIITLIHVIQHEDVPDRILWVILHLIVGSIIGPIYWLMVKKPYDKKHQ